MSRILVVDDDFAIRLGLQYLLEDEGHEVVLARDTGEASELLRKTIYDLAIVDLNLPDIDGHMDDHGGIKLLQHMQVHYTTLPAIVLTVHNDPETTLLCQQISNIKEYIVKDPNPLHIKESVKALLGSRGSAID